MSELLAVLEAAAPRALLGSSLLLGLGLLVAGCCKEPLHRQRAAECATASTLVWLLLVLLPLPAPLPAQVAPAGPAAPAAARPAERRSADLAWLLQAREAELAAIGAELPQAPAPAPKPAPTPTDWIHLGVRVWLAGCALGLAWLGLGVVVLARLVRHARPMAGMPQVLVSRRAHQPFCCWFGRDRIVLPAALCTAAAAERLQAVLDHEQAHLAQRDPRGRVLFALALPLLVLHPCYWLLRRTAFRSAELVADELAATRTSRARYARAMIDLAAVATSRTPWLLPATPAFRGRSEFYRRMKMLLQRQERLVVRCAPIRRAAHAALALLALAALTAGTNGMRAQEQDPAPAEARHARLVQERDALQAQIAELRAAVAKLQREREAQVTHRQAAAEAAQAAAKQKALDDPLRADAARAEANPLAQLLLAQRAAERNRGLAEVMDKITGEHPAYTQARVQAAGSDVLGLVTRAIDLDGEVTLAKERLGHLEARVAAGAASQDDVLEAKVRLKTATKKRDVVRTALETEQNACEHEIQAEMKRLEKDPESADVRARLIRLKGKLTAIQQAR